MASTIIALVIVIGIIVFVHELGHFMAARWAGARVTVFSIGFGKPLIKWRDRMGTEWRIAWLPLGGFVSIYGQDDMFDRRKYQELPAKEKIGHYMSMPAWKQAVVIGAGVFMNLLTAWVIYSGLFMGKETVQLPVVGSIEQTTQNLKPGDRIMQVNKKAVSSWSEMLMGKELNAGHGVQLLILRGEKLIPVAMSAGRWGAAPDASKTETVRNGFFKAIGRGAAETWSQSKMIFVVLKQMITGERSSKQLGGFISIAEISGKALTAGFAALISVIALLSVNLGVINLFPLPVLDGGHLLILLLEAITRRKFHGRSIEWIMRAGWWLFITLIIFTFWNDIFRLIAK
ncbi:MAG: site-2 protease family protein [Rickettsiales bacterium]|jgi:regulator of sigma E protease|nr:site-2 protease family protein [Rickettsiales bacterium]